MQADATPILDQDCSNGKLPFPGMGSHQADHLFSCSALATPMSNQQMHNGIVCTSSHPPRGLTTINNCVVQLSALAMLGRVAPAHTSGSTKDQHGWLHTVCIPSNTFPGKFCNHNVPSGSTKLMPATLHHPSQTTNRNTHPSTVPKCHTLKHCHNSRCPPL